MEGSSDVECDLVGEVFEYLLSGKYCDGRQRKESGRYGKKTHEKLAQHSVAAY